LKPTLIEVPILPRVTMGFTILDCRKNQLIAGRFNAVVSSLGYKLLEDDSLCHAHNMLARFRLELSQQTQLLDSHHEWMLELINVRNRPSKEASAFETLQALSKKCPHERFARESKVDRFGTLRDWLDKARQHLSSHIPIENFRKPEGADEG
jgi:hypothetical protein